MTTYGPFAETSPRGQTGWIDDRRRPVPEHLRLMLGHLDGEEKYTYSIWRATNAESIVVTRRDMGDAFVQAAGSATAMTVEVRLVRADGMGRLYTVGRRSPVEGDPVLVPINDERAVRVSSNEIFDADEAAAIFVDYYRNEGVAESYALRELDLSRDQTVQRESHN